MVDAGNLRFLDTEKSVGLQEVIHRRYEKRVVVASGQVARKSSQVPQFSFDILYYQYPEHFSLTKFLLPVIPCEQILTHLVGRQSGERVRGVVERKGEGFRQGDAISRGMEGMYHGEILSSFLLRGQRYE